MLHCAYMFKDVFPIYQRKEPSYTSCPSKEGWEKVEKILNIVVVFSNLNNKISGSEYPMSNLFLVGVCKIKQRLDNRGSDESAFVKDMVDQMKKKFDKYCGECNLLMSIVVVALDFCFPRIYRESEVDLNIENVKRALLELYNEYVTMEKSSTLGKRTFISSQSSSIMNSSASDFDELHAYVKEVETIRPNRTDLDMYFEDV
ncbi:unnamed protein product [Cuscuta europaea]|uniref:hAT-like transposase RNase-H fold domain-containing protein n=1 Tax=Cuscuta europaea TaxID=41803 RepID=A0A9P1EMR0_CUSEU|nr:unnamed protein product [Cuscuta europaea]